MAGKMARYAPCSCKRPECGKTFLRKYLGQQYCSRSCAARDRAIRSDEDIGAYIARRSVSTSADPDACVLWAGLCNKSGAGVAFLASGRVLVSRLVYQRTYGPLPETAIVRHTCDHSHCINARHLVAPALAVVSEEDRSPRIPRAYSRKKLLSRCVEEQVFAECQAGKGLAEVGRMFGISRQRVRLICQRLSVATIAI